MTKLNLSKFSQKGVKLEHTKFLRYYVQDRLILLSGPYNRTYELPLGQNGNGLKMDKNSKRTEIKQGTEREWHGIARPVLQTINGNFFLTPTIHHYITESI